MPLIALPEVVSEVKLDPNAIVLVPSTILKLLLSQVFRPEQLLLTAADVAAEVVHVIAGKPGDRRAIMIASTLSPGSAPILTPSSRSHLYGSEIAPWFYPFPVGCTKIFRPPPVLTRPAEQSLLFLRRARPAVSPSGIHAPCHLHSKRGFS